MPKVPPAYGIKSRPKFSYHTDFIKKGVVVYLHMREFPVYQLLEQPPFLVNSQDDLSFGGKEMCPFLRT
jgi:hypothetical protein